ncbi:hypothetical protein B0T10DRAFT_518320 [Thelonectria olida]|uniref:Uncharacterized protein n=1 Tax=Thelonectria olida TaxID=1576542 RepID=A0A9P8VYU4_9HYPO|nr:hypothetical protein B0T10DRAFT_518320 [Thelonectria olida]
MTMEGALIAVFFLVLAVSVSTLASRLRSTKPAYNVTQQRGKQSEKPPLIEPLREFDWKQAEARKLRIFKPVYHISMGIRSDTPSELITIDQDYADRISLRQQLIAEHPNAVHGCVLGGEDAVHELYSYLLNDYLPIRFPNIFTLSVDKTAFTNHITGKKLPITPPSDSLAALRVLGETVEEELFLLLDTPDGHRLFAVMCCFPSDFDPMEKLGKTLTDIHGPVPAYEKIGPSMERFFRKLEVGKSVKRANWGIQTHAELFSCQANPRILAGDTAEGQQIDMESTYLRSELQTLTRLPKTRAILFSFKTYMYSIREIKGEGLGSQFADAIEGLQKGNAPGMWTYKGASRWGKDVCEYLRS